MAEFLEYRQYIGDYLRQKGIHTRKPFRCLNPKHEDKNPSMSFDPQRQNVHCFSCGVTYDLFDLVAMDYGLTSFAVQRDKIAELFFMNAESLVVGAEHCKTKPSHKFALSQGEAGVTPAGGSGTVHDRTTELAELRMKSDGQLNYFNERGISTDLCHYFGLFQSGGRAVLPVFDGEGRCLGWSARAIGDAMTPRYKNSAGVLPLWQAYPCEQAWEGTGPVFADGLVLPLSTQGVKNKVADTTVCITEGIFDALSLIATGRRAIALCGSQNTRKLFALLENEGTANLATRFLCCGDGDAAGRKMNAMLLDGLRALGYPCAALNLPEATDIGDLYRADTPMLMALLDECEQACVVVTVAGDDEYSASSALGTLDDFFAAAAHRGATPAVATGIAKLDTALGGGLVPGLIVLGAPSSIGKTSLLLQIADVIAATGTDVLFFSLEMSRHELMAKSLSRLTAVLDDKHMRHAMPARDILRGALGATLEQQLLLRRARAEYERFAGNLFLREGLADIGAEDIRAAVEQHICRRGKRPVVFIDYLQILRPVEPRATDKQNTDRAVVELKRVSRDFEVPVVAISSFNREGYRNAACMEAFKESGAVEYSSDVLLALQLVGTGEAGFDLNAAKLRDPREIELVMLKNRAGLPYAKLRLQYMAHVGVFR